MGGFFDKIFYGGCIMKKMVCEICGSQSIRKENGVFVCQECGTEYSVEDARKLLKEVEEKLEEFTKTEQLMNITFQKTDVSGKDKLISLLYLWAINISKMPNSLIWFDIDEASTLNATFWTDTILKILKGDYSKKFNHLSELVILHSLLENNEIESKYLAHRFYNNLSLSKELQNRISSTPGYINLQQFVSLYGEQYSFEPGGYEKSVKEYFNGFGGINFKESPVVEMAQLYNFKKNGTDKTSFNLYGYKSTMFFTSKKVFAPEDVQNKFNNFFAKSYQSVLDFTDEHNKLMDYYSNNYLDVCNACGVIYENCKELEKELFLPYKYRRIQTILDLIDIVADGKATNWQDLANLYDTHQFRAGVYEKLDTINNKLDNIQSTLITGFSTIIKILNDMQNQLVSINDKMTLINNGISKIKQYSFISMWNTL